MADLTLPEAGGDEDGEFRPPSKSARKREMTARQNLGEALCALSSSELARIPIAHDELLQAIGEARRISSNSARKRHMQFIGKLMRNLDPLPLQQALDELHSQRAAASDEFHLLEELRDRLLQRGDAAVGDVLERWPAADRQQLRQILRQHAREVADARPPAASRRLFRYLRQLQAGTG